MLDLNVSGGDQDMRKSCDDELLEIPVLKVHLVSLWEDDFVKIFDRS